MEEGGVLGWKRKRLWKRVVDDVIGKVGERVKVWLGGRIVRRF